MKDSFKTRSTTLELSGHKALSIVRQNKVEGRQAPAQPEQSLVEMLHPVPHGDRSCHTDAGVYSFPAVTPGQSSVRNGVSGKPLSANMLQIGF